MIWRAFRHTIVSEFYADLIVILLFAILGSLGFAVSTHSLGAAILSLVLMVGVYRLKYGHW